MKKLLITIFLYLPALVFGQGVMIAPQTSFKVVNGITMPNAGATITVCAANASGIPCSPALVSTIFSNTALTQPLSNPFTADSTGTYQFAAAAGNYTVTETATGFVGKSYQITLSVPSSAAGGLGDPGANGIVFRNGLNTTRIAVSADVIALFSGSCSVSTFIRGDGSCAPAVTTFDQIGSGTNISANMQVGSAAALTPLNLGQVAATQAWMIPGISAPSTSGTLSGGSIGTNESWQIQYTLNSAGESLPSVQVSGTTNTLSSGTCNSGSACTLTVVAPTLPSGYLSYSVYACDISVGPCTVPQKVAACTSITANCTFTASYGTNTSAVPTVNSAFQKPPNTQAFNGMFGEVPAVYFPKPDGNYYPWITVDWSTHNNYPAGTPTFTHRTFFSDFGNGLNTSPAYGSLTNTQSGNNAFVSLNHLYGVGTSQTNQDRALWITGSTALNDTSTHWALEGLQIEQDVNGGSGFAINGSPDGEISVTSLQLQNNNTAAISTHNYGYGANLIRAQYFQGQSGNNAFDIGNVSGVNAIFTQNATTNNLPSATTWTGFRFTTALGVGVNQTQLQQYGFNSFWSGIRFGAINIGYYNNAAGYTAIAGSDYLIRNDVANMDSDLFGTAYATAMANDNASAFNFTASENVIGSIATSQGSFTTISGGCAGGVTTTSWTYVFVLKDANGGALTTSNMNITCAATLDGTHFNQLQVSATAARTQMPSFVSLDVYRTVAGGTPSTTGKVGSIVCTTHLPVNGCPLFNDTGLTADGTTPPSANTTGGISSIGYLQAEMNHVQLTSDFTSAANTSLQTITGLSWTLDPSAKNYSFHCSLLYSQATAAVSMQFGIQAATANPTNINAKGRVDTSSSAQTSGTLTGLNTTTATSIVTLTPSATATVFGADLDGSIEEPAKANGQVINIMVQTSNSGDLPTVKRGSYCYLY